MRPPTFFEYGPCVTNEKFIIPTDSSQSMPYVQCHVFSSTPSRAQFCVHVAASSFGQYVWFQRLPV